MIRHVVLCKVNDKSKLNEIKQKIEDLKNHIDVIKHIEVGIDLGFDKDSSDFCIIIEVEDIYDLEIYATHPKHQEVIKFLKKYLTERKVVDYKC